MQNVNLLRILKGFYGLRKVEMNTAVSKFKVACHHLSGK